MAKSRPGRRISRRRRKARKAKLAQELRQVLLACAGANLIGLAAELGCLDKLTPEVLHIATNGGTT